MFFTLDELQEPSKLFDIFNIYKALIQLGEISILECLISEDFYEATFGALEYDPDMLDTHKDQSSSEQVAKFSPTSEDDEAPTEQADDSMTATEVLETKEETTHEKQEDSSSVEPTKAAAAQEETKRTGPIDKPEKL